MTLLEQQELMAPPPRRRLIVPKGHTAVWGVDGSTLRVAIAVLWGYGTAHPLRSIVSMPYGPGDGAQRLSRIYAYTKDVARTLCYSGTQNLPGLIVVEQPSGKTPNPSLVYAIGVIQAALFDGVYEAVGLTPRIETIASSSWKKRACGRGDIYKPQREKGQPRPSLTAYPVFRWALENGWDVADWDMADAAGIAEAAAREVLLEER